MTESFGVFSNASVPDHDRRKNFHQLFKQCPIPPDEVLKNLGLFINRQSLTRLFFLNEMYQHALSVHGVIMEFGVRWGQSLAVYESLRGMYEPYNYNRRIIGFDTFSGFPSVDAKDGDHDIIAVGSYSVTEGYQRYLESVLEFHEKESPVGHIKKFELVQGDATKTLPDYLSRNPHTIVALAYFDFDIYEPTKICLEAILPHLTKGSVIGFDETNHPAYPGETQALREVLGTRNIRLRRSIYSDYASYLIVE